jgi:prepilin-type N-terminal cleavage/methylation domain-containing protein
MPIVPVPRQLPRNAGMTLIEVLTAVSLMSILTAVAATNFTAMVPGFRTRGAALLIAGDVNQARMAAVKEGRVYEYFPIAGGYRIRRDDGAGGRELVKEVVIANAYPHVDFGHSGIAADPYAVNIASSVPTTAITFQSNGTVQNAAGVFLEAESSEGPVQQAVTLSAAGRVRVWKYSGGTWH